MSAIEETTFDVVRKAIDAALATAKDGHLEPLSRRIFEAVYRLEEPERAQAVACFVVETVRLSLILEWDLDAVGRGEWNLRRRPTELLAN
jgi:hypothetical protein